MPVDPSLPPSIDPERRRAGNLGDLNRRLSILESFLQGGALGQIAVVDALPPAGRQGRILMLASTSAIYKDTGVAWTLV